MKKCGAEMLPRTRDRVRSWLVLGALVLLSPPVSGQLAHMEPEWYLRGSDHCPLFVREAGRGPDTVIVLHGGFGAEHSYLLDAFQGIERRFHLIFYDQRGSLRSPCPDSLISVAKHLEDLDRLRAELGLERVTIAGHSMGTYLAMSYLDRHPLRVKGLVLLGALPARRAGGNTRDSAVVRFLERPAIMAQLEKEGLTRDTSLMSDEDLTDAWRIRFAGVNLYHVERWRQMKGGRVFYSARAGRAASRTMSEDFDFTAAIAAHPCAVSVVIGDHDYVDMGAKQHRAWTADLPHVTLSIVENAGHAGWVDAPREYRARLREGLERAAACRIP